MNESIFGLQIHVVLTVMIFQWKKINIYVSEHYVQYQYICNL